MIAGQIFAEGARLLQNERHTGANPAPRANIFCLREEVADRRGDLKRRADVGDCFQEVNTVSDTGLSCQVSQIIFVNENNLRHPFYVGARTAGE